MGTGSESTGCAGYCSATGSFTLSGTIKKPTTIPYEQVTLTLIYKVCDAPNLKAYGPNDYSFSGFYCSDGHLVATQTTTDCNGNYSFTVSGSILGAALLWGGWTKQSGGCRAGATFTLDDPTHYGCSVPTWSGVGSALPTVGSMGRADLNDSSDWTQGGLGFDLCGGYSSTAYLCEALPASAYVIWGSAPKGYTSSPNGSNPGAFCQVANNLSGSYGLNITGGSTAHLRAIIQKNGRYWFANNVNITVTDSCGKTETHTTGGTIDTYLCGGITTQVWHTDGWFALDTIDWFNMNSLTINSGIPAGCSGGCANKQDGSSYNGDGPPSVDCGGPYTGRLSGAGGYCDAIVTASDFSQLASLCRTKGATIGVIIKDCTGTVALKQQADTFRETLALAWITTGNALKVAVHNAPFANIGDGTNGWEATATIEAANADDLGLVFLPDGTAYLSYALSGAAKYRTNLKLANGVAGDWSASATPSPAVNRISANFRGQGKGSKFRASGNAGAGDIYLSECGDRNGATWSTEVAAISATGYGPFCGGVWLNNGYGLLYTRAADNHILWQKATNPDTWSGSGTDTGMTGIAVGLEELSSGTLVGLIWDSVSQKCRACRSRDRGTTWEKDGADIALIPALSTPPSLTSIGHYLIACMVTGDVPWFVISEDEGATWN